MHQQFQRCAGKRSCEPRERIRQEGRGGCRNCGNAQATLPPLPDLRRNCRNTLESPERPLQFIEEVAPLWCEDEAALHAFEECEADITFKLLEQPADSRLRNPSQGRSRTGYASTENCSTERR